MGSQHPQLLVIGGMDQGTMGLEDAWVLDLKTKTWRKVLCAYMPSSCEVMFVSSALRHGCIMCVWNCVDILYEVT